MKAASVLYLYNRFAANGVTIWIDGGWCVDALLGEQTRAHDDLDIAVHRDQQTRLQTILREAGFEPCETPDRSDFQYVLSHPTHGKLDVHVFAHDAAGAHIYGVAYPFGSLTGEGHIDGQPVHCVSAEWMVKFKSSYPPRERDQHDLIALCRRFGLPLPDGLG